MAKKRKPVLDYLVYLAVRLVVCVVQAMPLRTAYRLADAFAWLVYKVDRRHRLVADDNLRHAFPDAHTDAERDRLIRSIYRHFCRMVVEMTHLPRAFHITTYKSLLKFEGGARIVDRLLSRRPLMLVTGHLGNWEMAGYAFGVFGFRTYAIARVLDNPHLERFIKQLRQRTGQTILAKKGDFDDLQEILENGGVVATLGDQDAGQRGLFVPFFGRPASTHKAIALLSLQYQVPLLVAAAIRVGEDMRYEAIFEECIFPEDYEGQPGAVKAITERFTAAFERIVRRAPEQYFWLHRRWKHQPKVREKKAA